MKQKTLNSARIISLIIRKLLETIRLDERIELEEWILASPENEAIYNEIMDPVSIKKEIAVMPDSERKKHWEIVAERIAAATEKRVIKLQEKGATAIAFKRFLIESNRGHTVLEQPEGIYEFHIVVNDDMDIMSVGAAHAKILLSTSR